MQQLQPLVPAKIAVNGKWPWQFTIGCWKKVPNLTISLAVQPLVHVKLLECGTWPCIFSKKCLNSIWKPMEFASVQPSALADFLVNGKKLVIYFTRFGTPMISVVQLPLEPVVSPAIGHMHCKSCRCRVQNSPLGLLSVHVPKDRPKKRTE